MKKWFYNQDKKNNWQASLYNFIYIHFIKWKWLSLFISLTITISIFAYTQIEIYNNNENEWIRIFNQISITFIAGGGFSFFIRFFQHANIYKNELKKVILEEDLHIEKSRKERDNFFIDNLEIYSKFFLFKSFRKFIKRFFPEDFESLFGHNFDETIINRISNDLMISKTNNYVQKNADLKFTIKKYDDKNIILTQKFSADIYMVKDSIIFSRTYYNWVPNNHNINREKLVDIKEFKLGNVDYKENFIYLEDDGIEESIYKQIKTSKGVQIRIEDKNKVHLESEINFILSSEIFLYWNYKFSVYTKGVKIKVVYDKKDFSTNLIEFTRKEKLKGVAETLIYKHNGKTICMPEDRLLLVIYRKK